MDFKQVWLYTGEPYLAFKIDGEFQYPLDEWTDVPPPAGIYQPFYFNGDEWIGTSKEEWEANQAKPPMEPKALELLVSQLQLQLMIGNKKTKDLEDKLEVTNKSLADALLKITEIENKIGGNA